MPTLPKEIAGLIKGLLRLLILRPAVETAGNVAGFGGEKDSHECFSELPKVTHSYRTYNKQRETKPLPGSSK